MTMKKMLRLSAFFLLPLAVSLELVPLSGRLGQTTASANSSGSVVFQPNGSPRTTRGGASRGICSIASSESSQNKKPAIALIPNTDAELTTQAHPTIFLYIPDGTIVSAELSLWDRNQNGLYQTTVSLSGKSGIVGIELPDAAPSLEVGNRYKWSLALICDRTERSRDLVVEGWMQRTQLSSTLEKQIGTLEPLQRARLYAQNRIWYETLATLAQLRRSRPDDSRIATEWQSLLQSVGLQDVAQAPVINCCQSENQPQP
ncbi:MAG TPA: hypothetical protein DCY88_30100 [Cyanobacteria bacterium UBA11372]|nr:hypothetical protein [Cyanobacteria bacterium UBA11372]HBE30101.1 hypothetical protein [Cyanobacteria bacterium UBA11368]